MKLFLRACALSVLISVLTLSSADAALSADAGDPVVDVNNSAIAKLNPADGSVEWSVPVSNDGSLKVDPADLSVYTSVKSPNSKEPTRYKFSPDGTVNWASNRIAQSNDSTTAAASPDDASLCDAYTDSNPADAMVYRGGGDIEGDCGPRVYQVNKFNPAAINWSMDLSGYVRSVDALIIQPWAGGYLYAASAASSKIVVIDPATQSVVTSFETAIPPRHVAVNPNGGNLYIADGQNPFVISYSPTGALNWVNLNLGGAVSNIATAKGVAGVASASPCGAPTVRIFSSRNSIHKGESATVTIDYGSASSPPCNTVTVNFAVKTRAQNNVDFTFTDANGQDATVVGALLTGPLTLRNLASSRKKTLPVNIVFLKDRAYYLGNKQVQVELLAQ